MPHGGPHAAHPAPGSATPVEAAPNTLSGRLKAETREQHTAAERHPFHGHLFRGTLAREIILNNHAEHAVIQTALENRLRQSKSPHIVAMLRPYHLRASIFESDLMAAGITPAKAAATAAASTFIERINASDPLTLLGVLYVFEGSTNGGQFIQAGMAKHYPGLTLQALSPHGAEQHARWGMFRNAIDALPLTSAQADAVVAGADDTFRAVSAIMDEVMAKHGMAVTRPGTPS